MLSAWFDDDDDDDCLQRQSERERERNSMLSAWFDDDDDDDCLQRQSGGEREREWKREREREREKERKKGRWNRKGCQNKIKMIWKWFIDSYRARNEIWKKKNDWKRKLKIETNGQWGTKNFLNISTLRKNWCVKSIQILKKKFCD